MKEALRQTVKFAIDCETRELISAEALLRMTEADFSSFRRDAMFARVQRRRGVAAMRYECAICKFPVYLSRHLRGAGNRWFVHDGRSDDCPWYDSSGLTPEQTKALIYRGQQEGAAHRELKSFLAKWLAMDPHVSSVSQEQTTFSATVRGEWRRPDVKCLYRGMTVVFEIQLSYTFLSDVLARDAFYRREGVFIIWVFAKFELERAAVTDEAFFNRRNLFVLDEQAIKTTLAQEELVFSGYRQIPRVADREIHDVWTTESIFLRDVTFPQDTLRPYFFDYEAQRELVQTEHIDAWRDQQNSSWRDGIRQYLEAATRYYDSDYAPAMKSPVLSAVEALQDNLWWHRGLETLRDESFMGWHGVLPVLLSIRLNRPVGYKLETVFQVMEVGLRTSVYSDSTQPFAIPYLWAYRKYKPTLTLKHRHWVSTLAHRIKESIEAGESKYVRQEGYEEAIALLFPELESLLVNEDFGRR